MLDMVKINRQIKRGINTAILGILVSVATFTFILWGPDVSRQWAIVSVGVLFSGLALFLAGTLAVLLIRLEVWVYRRLCAMRSQSQIFQKED